MSHHVPALPVSNPGIHPRTLELMVAAVAMLIACPAKADPPVVVNAPSSNDVLQPAISLRTVVGQPTSTLAPGENGASPGYLFNTSTLLEEPGRRLADDGVYVRLGYTGDFADFVSGGRQQGEAGDNQFLYGVDLDLGRLIGLPDTKLHALIVSRFGAADNKAFIGSTFETFSDAGPTVTTRLTELSVEQPMFAGRLRLLVGRVPVGQEFATAPIYCQFVSGICLNLSPYAWPRNSNVGYWPLASWGGRATFQPTPRTYIKVGAFVADPASYEKSGWPWNDGLAVSAGDGAFIPVELGYSSNPSSNSLPRKIDIGGYYDGSTYADPLYNQAGRPRPIDRGMSASDKGRASIYVEAQQTVWRRGPSSKRGVTVFAGLFSSVAGHASASTYILTGLVDQGPFNFRSADTLGLMTYTVLLNQRVVEAYADSLKALGRSGDLSRSETAIELNYGIALAPGFAVKPFVQLVMHPDQSGLSPDPADTHAWVIGFQVSTALNDALGLPMMARPN